MSHPRRGPAYRIHTERLVLRCWEPVDSETLAQAIVESKEHLLPWMRRGENYSDDLIHAHSTP